MSRWLRDIRLLPVVLLASGSLLALKTFGLIFDGGYTLGQRLGNDSLVVTRVPVARTPQIKDNTTPLPAAPGQPQQPKPSWMREVFNYPGDVTGSIEGNKPAGLAAGDSGKPDKPAGTGRSADPGKPAAAMAEPAQAVNPQPLASGTSVSLDRSKPDSPAERALLERLQERRQELEARARELELRETMLKAEEKKSEAAAASKAEDSKAATAKRSEEAEAALKSVVIMYETMKPKDAAKIFDRLDINVLLQLATQIKPQKMADILAQMNTEAAERLTVELAARAGGERVVNPSSLPKIDGRPSGG